MAATSSSFARRPSSCTFQCAPPSSLCRITPSCPTAQPVVASTNQTEVRSELTGTGDCVQVAPPSAETTM
jgi:hypothetical protein